MKQLLMATRAVAFQTKFSMVALLIRIKYKQATVDLDLQS
jgi:hypothetical protein